MARAGVDGCVAGTDPPPPPPSSALEPFEEILKFIEFKLERISADCVEGRFVVSHKSCQPFGVLHGGVSALIAEALASTGAFVASGCRRVAGVQLTINHVKAAPIGTLVLASAKPVNAGKRLHVWDVVFSKGDEDVDVEGLRIALARVTLMVDPSGVVVEVDERGKLRSRL